MKHKGSSFEYEEIRNRELFEAYKRAIRDKNIPPSKVYEHIVNQPCSRFWVSEERATYVIAQMKRGDMSIWWSRPNKLAMFEEICRRVELLLAERPETTLFNAVFEVVGQPAPCFYITSESAKVIISKIRNSWYEKRKEGNPIHQRYKSLIHKKLHNNRHCNFAIG